MDVFSIALSLFILMDSFGNVPIFVAVLKRSTPREQTKIIFRELCIALALILIFFFVGNDVLNLLHIAPCAVPIAGGIILFMIAIKMIFPTKKDSAETESLVKDPLIVPLAVPLVAGPAVLAAVMIYARQIQSLWVPLWGILLAWLGTTVVLMSASLLKQLLGERGLTACERLMGLLLTLLSVQMFLQGLTLYNNGNC